MNHLFALEQHARLLKVIQQQLGRPLTDGIQATLLCLQRPFQGTVELLGVEKGLK